MNQSLMRHTWQMLMSLLVSLLVLFGTSANSNATTGPGDWWMYQHDLQHTGRSCYCGPNRPMPSTNVIRTAVHGSSSAPSIAADGTVYYLGGYFGCEDILYAFNPNGTLKWQFSLQHSDQVNSPTISSDGTHNIIYLTTESLVASIKDMGDAGELLWVIANGNFVGPPQLLANGDIYVAGGGAPGTIFQIPAFGLSSTLEDPINIGDEVCSDYWLFTPSDNSQLKNPVFGTDGRMYITASNGNLYICGLDGQIQNIVSSVSGCGNNGPSIGADGTVYCIKSPSFADYEICAVDPITLTSKWQTPWLDVSPNTTPAIGVDGMLFQSGHLSGGFYAINPANGTSKAHVPIGVNYAQSATIGGDGIVYYNADNVLYGINPHDYSYFVVTDYGKTESSIAIGADGTIYYQSSVGSQGYFNALLPSSSPLLSISNAVTTQINGSVETATYTLGYNNTSALKCTPLSRQLSA